MKDWFKRFIAVDNSINENTVMGVASWVLAIIFAGIAIATTSALVPMGSFLGFGAACFGLSWKYK